MLLLVLGMALGLQRTGSNVKRLSGGPPWGKRPVRSPLVFYRPYLDYFRLSQC